MRTGRSYVATAVALGIISLMGCAADTTGNQDKAPVGDWGDETKYPELGGAFQALSPVTATPVFATGTLTVTSAVAETIIIGKRAVDSAILVNGVQYGGVTAATLKKLVITGAANNQVVILDFLGGVFAPGTATARGIVIDLGAGANELHIRGSSAADTFSVGTDGVSFNSDAFRDIDVVWTGTVPSFALAAGADVFSATAAGKGVAGSFANALTVYGGNGADVITGGSGNDHLYGGADSDTLSGGGTADTDRLYGEAGADTILQGADKDGADTIHCGTEAVVDPLKPVVDVLSYALRGTATARDQTNDTTKAATDGERLTLTIGGAFTDVDADAAPTPGPGDLDAEGYVTYTTTSGQGTEATANGALGAITITENDIISADCESVLGGMDNDVIVGDASNNTISGGAGADTLTGNDGDDVLNGDADDDTFDESTAVLGAGGDIFNGGAGIDTVDYHSRTGSLTVSMDGKVADDGESGDLDNVKADVENILCGTGADTVVGNALNNVITGDMGADTLNGGAGDDTFNEGAAMSDGDVFVGGLGIDTVDYSARTVALVVTMDGLVADDGESGELDNVSADVENLTGGTQADSITGNALDNVIHGGLGDDTLLSGLDGDDFLDGDDATLGGTIVCGNGDDIAINFTGTRDLSCEL